MITKQFTENGVSSKMNPKVREAILSTVQSYRVLSCLEIAEMLEPEDFSNFSHTNVDILENYIRCRTSVMDINERLPYLSEEFIHHPDKFMFTPGIRNRLLKASRLLCKDVYGDVFETSQSSDCESNEMTLDESNSNAYPQLSHMINPLNIMKEQFQSTPLKTETLNRSRHIQNMNKYNQDIVNKARKYFVDCNLEPGVDFHLSIPDNDITDLNGYFHCHICTDRKKSTTKIKFRFSKYSSVIYTNIISHLKAHFPSVVSTTQLTSNSGTPNVDQQSHQSSRKKLKLTNGEAKSMSLIIPPSYNSQLIDENNNGNIFGIDRKMEIKPEII